MNKNTKLIVLILAFTVLLGGAVMLYNGLRQNIDTDRLATNPPETTPTGENSGAVTSAAPNVALVDWDGNDCQLSDFIGKPVILNFWASWCGPCQSEMPDFEEAYLQYGDQIHFLMVNCTTSSRETRAKAVSFIQDQGYTFPVYFDTTGAAAATYGAYSIPLTFFIDAEGNLVAYAQGAIDAEVLRQGMDMILPK